MNSAYRDDVELLSLCQLIDLSTIIIYYYCKQNVYFKNVSTRRIQLLTTLCRTLPEWLRENYFKAHPGANKLSIISRHFVIVELEPLRWYANTGISDSDYSECARKFLPISLDSAMLHRKKIYSLRSSLRIGKFLCGKCKKNSVENVCVSPCLPCENVCAHNKSHAILSSAFLASRESCIIPSNEY